MRNREEQREDERRYEADVYYDVWRNGGDPDRINFDRVENHYYNGDGSESATRDELRRQRPQP